MTSQSLPKYLYKILPWSSSPLPDPLPAALPVSTLDSTSGFVHLSTGAQVLGTLRLFFPDDERVIILRVPYERVAADIRWESPDGDVRGEGPGEGMFPHLYNGLRLGSAEVDAVGHWSKGKEGWEGGGGELVGWDKGDMV